MLRKCVDRACEDWWEAKAAEAERVHEVTMSLGHGGSLLKDLKLLRCRQMLKADTMLFAQDGSELHSMANKLERRREHFEQVSSVLVELEESVVSAVLESVPDTPQGSGSYDSLVEVPSEGEIRMALNVMKNGLVPGADGISAELLRLEGEEVVQCWCIWCILYGRRRRCQMTGRNS